MDYSSENIIEKNRNTINADLVKVIMTSKIELISTLFAGKTNAKVCFFPPRFSHLITEILKQNGFGSISIGPWLLRNQQNGCFAFFLLPFGFLSQACHSPPL